MTEQELSELLAAGKLVGGSYNDQNANSRRIREAAFRKAVTPVDTSGLEKVGREREALGLEQQGQGIMLGTGPSWLAPMGQTAFKSGIEKQGPWEVGEGIYSQGAYTEDPYKRQNRLTKALEGQSAAQSDYGTSESQERGRVLQRAATGQSMQLARQRDAREQAAHDQAIAMGKIQKVKDADGAEMLVRVTPTGYEVVSGGGSPELGKAGVQGPGKLTEVQAKAYGAAVRAQDALPIMAEVVDKGYKPTWGDATWSSNQGGILMGPATNMLATKEGKRFYGAGRDILAALLRKESGAAVTENEWKEFAPLWLPWYTDTPELRADKLQRLESQLEAAKVQSGPRAARYIEQRGGQAPAGAPARGGGDVARRAMGYVPQGNQ